MERVLATGGGRYIVSHAYMALAALGYELLAVDGHFCNRTVGARRVASQK